MEKAVTCTVCDKPALAAFCPECALALKLSSKPSVRPAPRKPVSEIPKEAVRALNREILQS